MNENYQERKEQLLTDDSKELKVKYAILIILTVIAFVYIFGLISYVLIDNWEGLKTHPLTGGWQFFFALLIFGFFLSVLLMSRKDILVVIISSLIALFWEAFAEPFGWYFKLWGFAPTHQLVLPVFHLALQLGLEFYAFYYLVGMLYLFIYKSDFKYRVYILLIAVIILTILGWLGDIFISMFDTYVITFIVWSILNSLHLMGVIFIYRFLNPNKKRELST
ncbi:MAG: hypothetical protein GF383_15900 [Candidatus Lokiarchaeota archaeon]|nr:hypothetical protein [Candidatus Lokiarchaeota archaeon]MBD3343189.1 hypothetical protein [Candidatus Lokiarchaeota archaeon]